MIIELRIPEKLPLNKSDLDDYKKFLQMMLNRIVVGNSRYGRPEQRKKYMSRLKMEINAYLKTGNHEQLINISNYAWLESYKPENKRYHFDPTINSVTRGKI